MQVEVFRIYNGTREIDDTYWMFPVGTPQYIEFRKEIGIPQRERVVDMTGVLGWQMPIMAARRQTRFGRDYYAPNL